MNAGFVRNILTLSSWSVNQLLRITLLSQNLKTGKILSLKYNMLNLNKLIFCQQMMMTNGDQIMMIYIMMQMMKYLRISHI